MEDSIKKGGRKDSCFSFELEKWSQQILSPASLQERKVLKGRALYRGYGIEKIIVKSLAISLILGLYSPAGSFFPSFFFLNPFSGSFGLNPL